MGLSSSVDDIASKGIFIIHALKGYELHEKRIRKIFAEQNLGYELVTDGDPIYFNPDVLAENFVHNIQEVLPKGILSCTLNHIYAYRKIVERQLPYAIVFENDPYFLGDFRAGLEAIFPEIESLEAGFIISIENTTLRFPSYWDTVKGKHLYRAKVNRMAGGYIIDLTAAQRILQDLETTKCHTVIDWWQNNLVDRNVVKMYWAHPALTEQGSHNGHLSSVISSKANGFSRRAKWNIQKAYKYYFRRILPEKKVIRE